MKFYIMLIMSRTFSWMDQGIKKASFFSNYQVKKHTYQRIKI